tara:strand:+ start:3415 stop:4089 length:675 start_codon:yes stop_codon:yes gene_type:complete
MKRYYWVLLLMFVACKKEVIPDPEPALLLGPENNNNCTTAIRVSDQQSQVNFSWQESLHTDEYELVVRDILTNVDQKKITLRLSSSIVLESGKQYSWWVNSKSLQTEKIAKSQVWTFYIEGIPNSSHFPFPAKLLSPENNTQVSLDNGVLTLRWEAVDLDNDVLDYDVYLGSDPDDLELAIENLITNSISANLIPDRYYYWKVATRDKQGNVSNSDIGVFRTSP